MRPVPFIAASAEEAVSQIRAKLGPEAIVLNVRPLPANGLARLWQKPMIEVLAYLPETKPSQAPPISEALLEFQEQLNEIKQQVKNQSPRSGRKITDLDDDSFPVEDSSSNAEPTKDGWRVGSILQRTGLLPLHTQSILDRLRSEHGETPPGNLDHELDLTRNLLRKLWRKPKPIAARSLHVLVGDRKSTRLNSSHCALSRMPSSA